MASLHQSKVTHFSVCLYRLITLVMALTIGGCSNSLNTDEGKAREQGVLELERYANTHVRIGLNGTSPAANRFILLRKDRAGCAVKFTSYRRDHDWKPGSWTSTGDENTYAEYDWYYQGDGSFDFRKSNVLSGHGKLRWGPITRLGHGLLLRGPSDANRSVDCGSFHVAWGYPMNLSFFSFEGEKSNYDPKLEFAPTRWTTVDQIDVSNKKLVWTSGPAANRLKLKQDMWIPLEDLP
jgi:hypothetical protein